MTITVSTTDPRSLKALAILATADRWQRGHTRDGRSFFAIPSQSGDVLHMVDARACTCPDFRRRGLPCKHILACRLSLAKAAGERPRPPKADQAATSEQYARIMVDHFGGEG